MNYEEALEKLNKIKDELDSPSITLDKALSLYEESVKYTKLCLDLLKSADGKIVAIKQEMDALVEKPINIDEE